MSVENKITDDCKGCESRRALSLHGGDMPTTFICCESRKCSNLDEYEPPLKIEKETEEMNILKEIKKEIIEAGKAIKNSMKLIEEYEK